ncbi:MAG: PilZ domain-containing protein [Emcibacter sp.]|nr:PilZ domain-containing protein [Emcibacter sp.]
MTVSSMSKEEKKLTSIKNGLESMRSTKRRTVVWPAKLQVGEFEFRSTMYDISLGGIRVKLSLPLARGTEASITIKNQVTLNGRVVWCAGEFMGLKFCDPIDVIRKAFKTLSVGL